MSKRSEGERERGSVIYTQTQTVCGGKRWVGGYMEVLCVILNGEPINH